MMKGLLNVLHPTFDALSAYADLSELDGARTRVGRHVARCAQCREVVNEIRGLGAAARESEAETESAPDGLWARIETAAVQAAKEAAKPRETPPPDAVPWEVAPSMRPTRHWPIPTKRSLARIGGGLAVAAAALIAVVLGTGRTPSLQASAPSRLTMTPFRPAPGSKVHVRFNPTPKLAGYDQIMLVGQYLPAAKRAWTDFYFGGNYDSLATLHRAADGAMVGDFTVPPDFKAASILVVDPTGWKYDADGLYSWILVGGDSRGRPVLNSLLGALSLLVPYGSNAHASVLDTLQRYFPEHPAGFATAKRYRGEGIFADMFKFFQGAERKYIAFNSKLERQPSLDAGRLAAMVDFAYEIQEPGEAAKWTRRLVREHPGDPRSLPYYANMVHQIELKEPPADSIRSYLPLLDTLYELAGAGPVRSVSDADGLVTRYGDPAMQRRWILRSLQRTEGPVLSLDFDRKWLTDREIRDQATLVLRAGLAARCEWPPRWMSRGSALEQRRDRYCRGWRAGALSTLSGIALLDGQTSHALALADSGVALDDLAGRCGTTGGRNSRGEALLARGDTLAAAHEFAFAVGWPGNWQSIDAHKAIVQRLGTAVDSAKWAEFDAEAGAEWKRCLRASTVRDSLEKLSR